MCGSVFSSWEQHLFSLVQDECDREFEGRYGVSILADKIRQPFRRAAQIEEGRIKYQIISCAHYSVYANYLLVYY